MIKKEEKVSCFGSLRSGERKNDKNIKSTTLFLFPTGSIFTFFGLKLAGKDVWEVFRG